MLSGTDHADLRSQQRLAEEAGRRCVVAALIVDRGGRVFVHRRGPQRAFLPGGWDLPGGHLEPGESLLDGLAREIREETGWTVTGLPQLVYVADWWTDPLDPASGRREFDFLVAVDGDLDRPRLEWPKHVEIGWIGPQDVHLLDENRGRDSGLVRHAVELAHRLNMAGSTGHPHVGVFLDVTVSGSLERLRAAWDPAMASRIAPHVTLAYPHELDNLPKVIQRAGRAAGSTPTFRLQLERMDFKPDPPTVFVRVADRDGGWQRLRGEIVPDTLLMNVQPHVTIVHPRTSNLAAQAWQTVGQMAIDAEQVVREIAVTRYEQGSLITVASFPLRG